MRIRPAHVGDAGAVAEVHVRSWQVGYRGLLPDELLDGLDTTDRVQRWHGTLERTAWPDRGTLVADDDGSVLGFASLCPTRDADHDPQSVGEVAALYVAPAAWRRGVGRRLMDAARTALTARYRYATLWVLASNARAIRFYEASGWLPDGAVKDMERAGAVARHVRYVHRLRGS